MRLDHSPDSEKIQRNTFFYLLAVVIVFFAVMLARLWYLQVIKGDQLRQLSENNRIKVYRIAPPRGTILDISNETLVDNAPSFDIYYAPDEVRGPLSADTLNGMTDVLGMDHKELAELIKKKGSWGRPVRIRTDVDRETLVRVETEIMLREGAFPLQVVTELKRSHAFPGLLSHVLGYCGKIDPDQLNSPEYREYRPEDLVGKTGVEEAFEEYLHGRPGREWVEENAQRVRLRLLSREEARRGSTLVMTIDADLQKAAAEAFDHPAGAVVALDPRTGYVLAMHSEPGFDSGIFSRITDPASWKELLENPLRPLTDKAVSGRYPPGSTLKPFVALAGLAEGAVTPQTAFGCQGQWKLGNWTYRCWRRSGHGPVNMTRAIAESCDVYFYNLGHRLGIEALAQYASMFGFGTSTGLGLVGESSGLVPTREWKKKRFGKAWLNGETIVAAIGQGYFLATPLQVAVAFAALVNGGVVYRPQVARRILGPEGETVEEFAPEPISRIDLPPRMIEHVKKGLVAAVEDRRGTAHAVRIPGLRFGGKTGTAQVVSHRGRRQNEEIEYRFRDHAWFACYAPVEDPRVVVVVLIEHGGHGASAAAPIARRILASYFGLEP